MKHHAMSPLDLGIEHRHGAGEINEQHKPAWCRNANNSVVSSPCAGARSSGLKHSSRISQETIKPSVNYARICQGKEGGLNS